jgi:nicotinamide-nucleotide amidase
MDELIEQLFKLLDKHKFKIATAESCTGGMIAAALTDKAGSSAYFERGFVTYSNEAKMEQLGVNPVTIQTFGAVSEQCARLMARGAYAHSLADIAVSVTGIAGPGGGSDDKPVGLVYIGLSLDDHAEVHKYVFKGDRAEVRQQSVEAALKHVIALLENNSHF